MSLGRQLILLGATILLLVTLAITLLASDLYSRSHQVQVAEHSHGLHSILAESLAGQVIRGEALAVKALLLEHQTSDPRIAYLYVTDFDGGLFAHTFSEGFPRALLSTLKGGERDEAHRNLRTVDGNVNHFSAPLIKGMNARLYLGIDDSHLQSTLAKLHQRVTAAAVALALIGLSLGAMLAKRISDPLSRLTTLVDRYAQGRALNPQEVPISGPLEVQSLGQAMAGMLHEREILEHSVRESEAYLRMLFETTPIGLALTRMDGSLVEVNPAYAAIIGHSVEEVLDLSYWEITPEEYYAQEQEQLAILEQTGQYGPYEKEYLHADGHRVPVRLSGRTIEREGQRYIWSAVEDISAARQARALDNRLRNILENSYDEIYIFDGESLCFTQVSKGALKNLGYSQEEIQEMTALDLKPDFTWESFNALLEPLRRGEQQRMVFETRHQRKDGSHYPVEVRLQFSHEAQGAVFFAIILDLTERKRHEAELISRRDQLEEMVQTRTAQLQASNAELEAFSYSVSHDLRAPLRAIDGFSLALIEDYSGQLDVTAHDYLQRVRGGAQRMGMLIDDMLQLSRVNRGELKLEQVDLAELAQTVMAELRAGEPDRNAEFSLGKDLLVQGDPRLLRVMLDNLLGNAWKFTAKEAVSRITFDRQPDKPSVFYIQDNGVGFDMRHAGKLFGAFQRLHRASEFAGTGVGLATVQRIIHRHGGRVWAEASEGEGATFYFSMEPTES